MKHSDGFRMAPQQMHLWRLCPEAAYSRCSLGIHGLIDQALLETAIRKVCFRHEILRTRFPGLPGTTFPLQVIEAEPFFRLTVRDMTSLSESDSKALIDKSAPTMPTFNFERGSLLFAALTLLHDGRARLELVLPGLCSDTVSLSLFLEEILCGYGQALDGSPAEAVEGGGEVVQYADVAEVFHEFLESEDTRTGRNYWRRQDLSHVHESRLVLNRNGVNDGTFQPRAFPLDVLPADLTYPGDLESFLLSCWLVLLHRLHEDIPVTPGRAYACRSFEELARAQGLFARYLPVTVAVMPETPLADLVAVVEKNGRELARFADYFSWQGALGRQEERERFFAHVFDFNDLRETFTAGEARFLVERLDACFDRYILRLACVNTAAGTNLTCHFDAGRCDVGEVRLLVERFAVLLRHAAASPDTPILRLNLLSEAERRELLVAWNDTEDATMGKGFVVDLFLAQARREPRSIAVIQGDLSVSYEELLNRVCQLANHLHAEGIGPEARVAICRSRDCGVIISVLSVLAVGAAFLPIDPAFPRQRIVHILEDSGARLVLCDASHAPHFHDGEVAYLDPDRLTRHGPLPVLPAVRPRPESLAYVIYTSGSTGRPKGVMVTQRGLSNYLQWAQKYYRTGRGGGAPLHSPLGFDLTLTSLFLPLLSGAPLHLLREETGTDALEVLGAALQAGHSFNFVKLTPSHLEGLAQMVATGSLCNAAHTLIVGGEALRYDTLEFWQALKPPVRIVNEYGPTETVVGCCAYDCTSFSGEGGVPIGRPIANTRIYLLDREGQPVPKGLAGEIHVGGLPVARGYAGRPGGTATCFIPDPFSKQAGGRLYKTGDLARFLADGNARYEGRIDHQIKIRGVRIEPGEIEAALVRHPRVAEAVVLARHAGQPHQTLTAFVRPQPCAEADSEPIGPPELAGDLARYLPAYMIPAVIVVVDAIPLTANAKLDRRALEKLGPMGGSSQPYQAPRTDEERILAEIWAGLLGRERVGVHDNFFELGGDSILCIQAVARARQKGLQLTPNQVFRHQNIAELATAAGTVPSIWAEQGPVSGPVALTPIQHWFFEKGFSNPHHFNQSLLLETPPDLEPDLLKRSLQALVEHHDALRMRFRQEAGIWCGENLPKAEEVAFSFEDLSVLSPRQKHETLEAEAVRLQGSLHLTRGPLMRIAYFRYGSRERGRLLLIFHHLIMDGFSWRILLEDMQTAYGDLARHEKVKLPAKTTSFKQWARALRAHARSGRLRDERDLWLAPERCLVQPLPTDFTSERATPAEPASGSLMRVLDESLTRDLLQRVPAAYHTRINDVLLTALLRTVADWTGRPRVLIDLESHGREPLFEDVDLSRTVGWFTYMHPLVLTLSERETGACLKTVKEQLRRVPGNGIGFGLLRHLGKDPALTALPTAEILFNYLGQTDRALPERTLLGPARESCGPNRPHHDMSHLLEINAIVAGGALRVKWSYSRGHFREKTVERLATDLMTHLRTLIDHCLSPQAGGYTPSDFPEADLSQEELDQLAEELA